MGTAYGKYETGGAFVDMFHAHHGTGVTRIKRPTKFITNLFSCQAHSLKLGICPIVEILTQRVKLRWKVTEFDIGGHQTDV